MYVNNKGFTLIELLLVIAAISILAGIIVTAITGGIEERKKESNTFNEVKTRIDVKEDRVDCEQFRSDYRSADFLNIPSICFDYYDITDAKIEALLKSQERYIDPCNN